MINHTPIDCFCSSHCVGGETAEMPGMYADDDFDLAGFSVGAVEKEQMLPRLDRIADDDVIIGLPSSGVHSNGYSMVRKVLEISCTSLEDQTPFDTSKTFGQVLLTPTRLYVKSLLPIIQKFGQQVVALCHITGGGLVENIPRILPEDKCAELDGSSWQPHPIFDWLHQTGKVVEEEMLRTFNCGLGMVVIVKRDFADAILKEIKQEEPNAVVVGFIRPRVGQAVVIKNVSSKSVCKMSILGLQVSFRLQNSSPRWTPSLPNRVHRKNAWPYSFPVPVPTCKR